MAKTEMEIKEKYEQLMDPKEFHQFKLDTLLDGKADNFYDFYFQCLYEYFSSAGFTAESRLLELGSGPTVHNVASASAFVPHMVLSELVESSCEELRKWLRREPGRLDWTPFLERVAKAEGRSDTKAACQEIEDRIRSAVKEVVHCDVLDEQVVAEEIRKEPYDVVLSCLTLETAAPTLKSYSAILGRIRKLLKPKGKLVLAGVIRCSYWTVGKNRFHCLPLGADDIERALQENNYGDIKWRLKDRHEIENLFDGSQVCFLTCTKM